MPKVYKKVTVVVVAAGRKGQVLDSDGDFWKYDNGDWFFRRPDERDKWIHCSGGLQVWLDTAPRHHVTIAAQAPTASAPVTIAAAPTKSKHQLRKERPLFRGVVRYFPDALAEVANLSRVGNEQHNAGQPMHWAYGKSSDHGDCILRHQMDYQEMDDDGILHAIKVAWRALAQAQTELEKRNPELHAKRQAQRDAQARGE